MFADLTGGPAAATLADNPKAYDVESVRLIDALLKDRKTRRRRVLPASAPQTILVGEAP